MVFLPGISKSRRRLEKRKGGGGRGGGGGGRGGSGGEGGGRSSSISAGGGTRSASDVSPGGGPIVTIPPGQPFGGRTQGGGLRTDVFGSRQYGSGYPGASSARGVTGLGFPFYFWPVVWGGGALVGTGAYLHSQEYGDIHNSSRPGGALTTAAITSNSTNSTFRLLSDNTTVTSLITSLTTNCSSFIASPSSIVPASYNDSGPPTPGQAIQYYRASSVVLSLDSYNNTAVYTDDGNAPDSPLPNNTDSNLLNCLNSTIGQSVPLVDGASGLGWSSPSGLGLLVLVWTVSRLASQV